MRNWGARWPVALIYPQIYPVAMGNLGFQTIYRLLNDTSSLHCERAFLPSPEDWREHQRTRTPILALESQRPLSDFAALAFSISFEADYPYVLQILEGAGVPLLAAARRPGDPLVLAGGVATFLNPEPLAPFVDAFFLGEGEAGAVPFFQFLAEGPGGAAAAPAAARPGANHPRGLRARRLPAPLPPGRPPGCVRSGAGLSTPGAGPAPAGTGALPYPQPPPGPPERMGGDVPGGDRARLLPGLPLLRRRLCLPPAPGAAAGGTVDPGGAGLAGKTQGGPGGGCGQRPPRHQRTVPENRGRGRRDGDQFAPGRLRRPGAFPAPGPGRSAERRPGPGGRQRALAPGNQQGSQPGRAGPGRGASQPVRHPAAPPLFHGGPAHRDPGGGGGNPPAGPLPGTPRQEGRAAASATWASSP